MAKQAERRQIPAIKVNQWLKGWDKIKFSTTSHRRKPSPHFYIFSLPAIELRSLCGIARRETKGLIPRASDLAIQRAHEEDRSEEINRFVEYGYPWSTLSRAKRASSEFNDLRKPGWLPTAIVINILEKGNADSAAQPSPDDLVTISEIDGCSRVSLPYSEWSKDWDPLVPPFEVIDGQHRLWAFDKNSEYPNYEVPVVAFVGLDRSWQAYLFWTINIKPKRINPSLAFDLYPLLRAEDWLDRAEGHSVYRETRAQELTEALWAHPESPWYDRINMLGERNNRWVSQAAWIKTLLSTFIRPWAARRTKIGGLFGSGLGDNNEVLGWNRAQQAAYLIFAWNALRSAIGASNAKWATSLRTTESQATSSKDLSQVFYDSSSLLVTDQGVRGFLHVLNDLSYVMAPNLKLRELRIKKVEDASDSDAVSLALKSIEAHAVASFVKELTVGLADFDWRTSAAPGLSEDERRLKLVFRGSGGYKEIRQQLLSHLEKKGGDTEKATERVKSYE